MSTEAMKLALEFVEYHSKYWNGEGQHPQEIATALREALAEQPAQQKPVNLRRGDLLRCIETDELCTVWATWTNSNTLIKWSANDFGSYTAEQIGELFWLEPAQQEPVAWCIYCDGQFTHNIYRVEDLANFRAAALEEEYPKFKRKVVPLYTEPQKHEWVGLTKEEVDSWELPDCPTVFEFVQFIEDKIKEKNI